MKNNLPALSAALRDVSRQSLVAALAQAREALGRFDAVSCVGSFDSRGMGDVTRRKCELEIEIKAIEFELRRRSLVENGALNVPVQKAPHLEDNARSFHFSESQKNFLFGLSANELGVRNMGGEYVVEFGTVGGTHRKGMATSGGVVMGDWRSQPRKAGMRRVRQIVEALLERGLVWQDEYGYIVLSEFGRRVAISFGDGEGKKGWRRLVIDKKKDNT